MPPSDPDTSAGNHSEPKTETCAPTAELKPTVAKPQINKIPSVPCNTSGSKNFASTIKKSVAPKNVIIEERSCPSPPSGNKQSGKRQAPVPPKPQQEDNSSKKKSANGLKRLNGMIGEMIIAEEEEEDRPQSPSPDYSNSPSPMPSPPPPNNCHRTHHHTHNHRSPTKQIGVDMQSLESFRLKNPPKASAKPPNVYFNNPTAVQTNNRANVRMDAYTTNNSNNGGDEEIAHALLTKCHLAGDEKSNGIGGCSGGNGQGKISITIESTATGGGKNGRNCHSYNPGMKPNGGILKMSNGNANFPVAQNGGTKTISFGGKF